MAHDAIQGDVTFCPSHVFFFVGTDNVKAVFGLINMLKERYDWWEIPGFCHRIVLIGVGKCWH